MRVCSLFHIVPMRYISYEENERGRDWEHWATKDWYKGGSFSGSDGERLETQRKQGWLIFDSESLETKNERNKGERLAWITMDIYIRSNTTHWKTWFIVCELWFANSFSRLFEYYVFVQRVLSMSSRYRRQTYQNFSLSLRLTIISHFSSLTVCHRLSAIRRACLCDRGEAKAAF